MVFTRIKILGIYMLKKILIPQENIIKISFRSQGSFDVNEFARAHFSGGGHINAAGGKSELSLEATTEKFEKIP